MPVKIERFKLKKMKELEKKLKQLQKDGYEQVTIIQVLNWMYEIKRNVASKRIASKDLVTNKYK